MDPEKFRLSRRNVLKGAAAIGAAAMLPSQEALAGHDTKKVKEKPLEHTDLSNLKESFPVLAEKWERISPLIRLKPWSSTFADEHKLGEKSDVAEFLDELERVIESTASVESFGKKYNLHDLSFGQIAGERGIILDKNDRHILSSLARAAANAGFSFDTAEKSGDHARGLSGKTDEKGQLSQLAYASRFFVTGWYQEYIEENEDAYKGLKPTKRMVVPAGQHIGAGGVIETTQRPLSEKELDAYLKTGEPIVARPQYLYTDDKGKNEWVDDEDVPVPRDLTYDESTMEVVPFAFMEKFPAHTQKGKGFSPSLALTIGYLQSLLHDEARNDPRNKGAGWKVTGNISSEFLNNLKTALDLASPNEAAGDWKRLHDLIAKDIIRNEVLSKVTGITLDDVSCADDLFRPLSVFLNVSYSQPIRSDFTVELMEYDSTLWDLFFKEHPYEEKKSELPTEIVAGVVASPKDERISDSNSLKEGFAVEIPESVLQLAQRQQEKIRAYESFKSSIGKAVDRIASESPRYIEVKKGSIIALNTVITADEYAALHNLPVTMNSLNSSLAKDDRTGLGWLFGSSTTGQEFSMNAQRNEIQTLVNAPGGTYHVLLDFIVELPEPPRGSPDSGRHPYSAFAKQLEVHLVD